MVALTRIRSTYSRMVFGRRHLDVDDDIGVWWPLLTVSMKPYHEFAAPSICAGTRPRAQTARKECQSEQVGSYLRSLLLITMTYSLRHDGSLFHFHWMQYLGSLVDQRKLLRGKYETQVTSEKIERMNCITHRQGRSPADHVK